MGEYLIVVLNGIAQSGKDTFGNFIKRHFEEKEWDVISHSTVDTVKEAAKLFGADEKVKKTDKERKLWSSLKDAYTEYNDGPFNEIVDLAYYTEQRSTNTLMIVHVREPKEIDKIKQEFKNECKTVLLIRDNIQIPDNHADQNVNAYNYDHYIANNGTLNDLNDSANLFCKIIGNKK